MTHVFSSAPDAIPFNESAVNARAFRPAACKETGKSEVSRRAFLRVAAATMSSLALPFQRQASAAPSPSEDSCPAFFWIELRGGVDVSSVLPRWTSKQDFDLHPALEPIESTWRRHYALFPHVVPPGSPIHWKAIESWHQAMGKRLSRGHDVFSIGDSRETLLGISERPVTRLDGSGLKALPGKMASPWSEDLRRLVSASRACFQTTKGPVFGHAVLGGFDTHQRQAQRLSLLFEDFATAFQAFEESLHGSGLEEATVLISSEFGRHNELNSNGGSEDHGPGLCLLRRSSGMRHRIEPGVSSAPIDYRDVVRRALPSDRFAYRRRLHGI